MYNGVGLPTPRGSGTSGHIQRNLGQIPIRRRVEPKNADNMAKPIVEKGVDEDLLEHERRRRVEVKVFEYQEELEEQGISGDELEEKIDQERQRLLAVEKKLKEPSKQRKDEDTHMKTLRKQEEDQRLRKAFGID